MLDTNTRSKKRAPKEADPATPSASASKKARKRMPEQQALAAEATLRNEVNRAAKKAAKKKKTKNRGSSPERDEEIARSLDKTRSESYGPLSVECPPTNARNLRNNWLF